MTSKVAAKAEAVEVEKRILSRDVSGCGGLVCGYDGLKVNLKAIDVYAGDIGYSESELNS